MQTKNLTVGFYLQEGVEILDFAGPMEVFSKAGFKIFTITKNVKKIRSQGIIDIIVDYNIADAPKADVLAFFGGEGVATSNDNELINWIISRIPDTQFFFSVCTGAFMLARAGILNGLTVTTYYKLIKELKSILPEATVLDNVRYVDNGHVITTAGISAGIDGALHFVGKMLGKDVAIQTAKRMEYDKWQPDDGLVLN
ncbi:MAG: DJ-1/PfpI family protein [Ginsengibacter sp.]